MTFSSVDLERLLDAGARVHELAPDSWSMMNGKPPIGIVLGSGWGEVSDGVRVHLEVPYQQIRGLGGTTVRGHSGRLIFGSYDSQRVLVWVGRRHYYEGEGFTPVAIPVYSAWHLGCEVLLLTNAAGGMQQGMEVGDLMAIEDHFSLLFPNILVGPELKIPGAKDMRFVPMNDVYDPTLLPLLIGAGTAAGKTPKRGVYAAVTGPSYEARFEVQYLMRQVGVDAVGMSTIPEATFAKRLGLRTAGLSCISNLAAGLSDTPPTHSEVEATLKREMPTIREVVEGFVARVHA